MAKECLQALECRQTLTDQVARLGPGFEVVLQLGGALQDGHELLIAHK